MRSSLLVVAMLLLAVRANSQSGIPLISGDTMLAGEIEEIFFVDSTGGGDPDQLFCRLWGPVNHEDTVSISPLSIEIVGKILKVTFDVPLGIVSGPYNFHIRSSALSRFWDYKPVLIFSKPVVTGSPELVSTCFGEDVLFEFDFQGSEVLNYQWYHSDRMMEGETGKTLQLLSVEAADAGFYYCSIENAYGKDTAVAELVVIPYQDEPGFPVGPAILCKGAAESSYTLPEDPLIDQYEWRLLPEMAGSLSSSGRAVDVQWSADYAGEALLFAETGLADCVGANSDTLKIKLVGPDEIPEICIVGVDGGSGYYRLVWNKIDKGSIVAYNIYRESNQAGVFLKLKTLDAEEFSIVVDSSSSPDVLPHTYKITYSDSCGNESDFSPIHKTMHLTANIGTGGENNLNWNHYEGFSFLSYQIMRGFHPDSMEVLQEVSSNVTSFSDTQPPLKKVYYQIAVSRDGACEPSKKSAPDYSISMSNAFEISWVGIQGMEFAPGLVVYPNPASEVIHVFFPAGIQKEACISVHDASGRTLCSYFVKEDHLDIPSMDLARGFYLLKLTSEAGVIVRRIILN